MSDNETIEAVVAQLQQRIDSLPHDLRHRRIFVETYQRTTQAVGTAIADARFEDPDWVERWDVVFARLYLDAHDAHEAGRTADVPRPWRLAFAADPGLPALVHVLLGINAHVNYDLPQAMLAVISDEDFTDAVVIDRRRRDHERIDAVLSSRVSAEDEALGGGRSWLDTVLTPLNRLASKRFLREARQKVWHNVGSSSRPGWTVRLPTTDGWLSWKCSARRGSRTCCGPVRCSSGWPLPGSASPCPRREARRGSDRWADEISACLAPLPIGQAVRMHRLHGRAHDTKGTS